VATVQVKLLALGASPIGTRTLAVTMEGSPRLADLYRTLGSLHGVVITVDPDRQARDERGGALSVLVNSRHSHHLSGVDTPLKDGDVVSILPLLSGG